MNGADLELVRTVGMHAARFLQAATKLATQLIELARLHTELAARQVKKG